MKTGATEIANRVKAVADRFGGFWNLFKMLSAVAGAFFLVMKWGAVIDAAQKFMKLLTGIRTLLGIGNLKLLGIIAVVAALILLVEDFVQFMLGNDSVIGYAFEKAGIDAEEMRQKIVRIWENLKKIFSGVWKTIVSILSPIGKFVKELFTDIFGPEIFAGLGEGIAGVIEFLERLTTAIAESEGAQQVIGGVIVGLAGLIMTLKIILPLVGLLTGSFGGLFNVVSMFGELFGVSFGGVALILGGAVTAVVNFVSMFRNGFNVVKEILMVLGIALAAVGAVILGAPATIAAVVAGIIAAVATLAVVVKEHWESIVAFFGKIGDGIKWLGDKAAQFLHLKPAPEEDDKPKARPKSDSGKQFSEALDNAGYSMDAMQSRFEALGVSAENFYDILDYAGGNADVFADALYEACNAGASFEDVQNALGVDLEELGQIMASASEFSAERFPAALESAGYSIDDMRARLETLGVSAEEFYDILSFANGNADLFADALYEVCDAGTAFEDVQAALGVDLEQLGEIMDAASVITEERFAQAMENAGYSADEMRGRLAELGVSSENFRDILSYSHGDADIFADALYDMCRGGVTFAEVEKALGVSLEELGQIMDSAAPDAEAFASAGEAVRDEAVKTKDALTSVMEGLPEQSEQWGADSMLGLRDGMVSQSGEVADAAKNVADGIAAYLHFSAPDVGPLADYETWMPDFISGLASGVQQSSGNLLSAINALGTRIRASVRDALNAVSSDSAGILGRLPSQAFRWGADFIGGLRNGIMSGVSAISNAVRSVAENIRSYLHFSAPDVGPLKDYENWMPDFTAGLARGFESGEDDILEKVRALASGISALTQSATVKATTAAATMVSNRTSNVTQNINIDNTYNGAATEGARSVTKAMRKSAYDATAYLARGLAMGR